MRKILIFTASLMVMLLIALGQISVSSKIVNAQYLPSELNNGGTQVTGNDGGTTDLHDTGTIDSNGNVLDGGTQNTGNNGGTTPPPPSLQNPLNFGSNVCDLLTEGILPLVVRIGSLIAVLFIIWSGFLFIAAQGNPTKITAAKKALMWTLAGTAILLGSSVIANIVVNTVFSVTDKLSGTTICNI